MGSAQTSDVFDTVAPEPSEPECEAAASTAIGRASPGALMAELASRWTSPGGANSQPRQRPLLVGMLAAVLGGGGGIGGSWLLGPGGLADDEAIRASVDANATAIAANAAAIKELAEDIDALAIEDRDLEAMIADGLVAQAGVLAKLAAKHDIDVDLRLPPLGRRRR